LLYCFQFLFPALIAFLIIVCIGCLRFTLQDYVHKYADDENMMATTSAYAFICVVFVLYVLTLDIIACVYIHRTNVDYFTSTNFDQGLFIYPAMVVMFDVLALIVLVLISLIVMCSCCVHVNPGNPHKKIFLLLTLAGVAPLLFLASHAHYILVAWLTHPIYASSIGIYYGITVFVHFFLLKQTYKQVSKALIQTDTTVTPSVQQSWCIRYKKVKLLVPAFAMFGVFLMVLVLQVLFTVFVVMIPISYSIRDTPNTVYTIIHGIEVMLLALVAYKVILDPKDSFSISGGVQIALARLKSRKGSTNGPDWKKLDDQQKLAEVLLEIFNNYEQQQQQQQRQSQQQTQQSQQQTQQSQQQTQQSQQNELQEEQQQQQTQKSQQRCCFCCCLRQPGSDQNTLILNANKASDC